MTRPGIAILGPILPAQMAQLAEAYVLHRIDEATDRTALLRECGADIRGAVTTTVTGIDAATLALLPALEVVASMGVGYERVDLSATRARGVQVSNTPDVLNDDVADMALALILMTRRQMIRGHALVASGDWAKGPMPLTSSLRGKRLGIFGLGRIGAEIARRCLPVGLEIGYVARQARDVPYLRLADLPSLAGWADILVVAVPGGPETRNAVDARVLAALGPTGTLINIARGETVDEDALVAALTSGQLGSAGLDVFWHEPRPRADLVELPNVTLSPHHGSGTVETRNAMAQLVVDNLAAHFQGRGLLTPI